MTQRALTLSNQPQWKQEKPNLKTVLTSIIMQWKNSNYSILKEFYISFDDNINGADWTDADEVWLFNVE